MRILLISCLVLLTVTAAGAKPRTFTKQAARHYVLNDYCIHDCSGYLRTRSPRFRRTFARALDGDTQALHLVFRARDFHSGDNEWWEGVPGNRLFVVGDRRFAAFLADLPTEERRWALMYIPNGGPFHDADLAGHRDYFPRQFPQTYRFYRDAFPEFAVPRT